MKNFLRLTFSLCFILFIFQKTNAQNSLNSSIDVPHNSETLTNEEKEPINPNDIIMTHVLDGHEFEFIEINGHPIAIPLPVLLYSTNRGWAFFSYANFGHKGEKSYNDNGNYYGVKKGKIIPLLEDGTLDTSTTLYDFSFTRGVVQLIITTILLCIILIRVAKKYKTFGVNKAPSGLQNFIEIMVTFVRDDIAKPNLGDKYQKFLPYLLSLFFFILINNIIGLIPGTANVSGNISFPIILGILSFILIMKSSNRHYWGHILNPPVPFFIKFILVPVEIIGIFTKPFALILRLFANMLAGHIAIICFLILIFILGGLNVYAGYSFAPFSVLFAVFMYGLEIIVVFLQAYIFTVLTAVFVGQAIEH